MENQCFVCSEDCSDSYFYLTNLASKKYKTKYTQLIGELINNEYELRVTSENKICEKCAVLLEKFDELQHETKTVKSVLSHQIAYTYSIETSETKVFLDKSKTFIEIRPHDTNEVKYSCKLCPRYVVDNIDGVNTHIMYHRIATEGQIQKNEVLKETIPTQKRNLSIARESAKKAEPPRVFQQQSIAQPKAIPQVQRVQEVKKEPEVEIHSIEIQQGEYDEEMLESLIDFDHLEDPHYDSNLKNRTCMLSSCSHKFNYISDYVRHLKLLHKSALNNIFAVVRTNVKKPKKVDKLMCPYCFTKTSDSQSLELHVKQHEDAAKSSSFNDRVSGFVSLVMSSSRCSTCDCEILDPTVLSCQHEIVKNGLVPILNCVYCTRSFYNEKLYNTHLALEHGHCFICGSICDDPDTLGHHIRSHASHAEYACTFCTDIYQAKSDRLEHIKSSHSDNCCTFCDEYFTQSGDLEHHVRYAHADRRIEEQKSSVCDACGASFRNKSLFENHTRTEHQRRKVYTCSACKDSFRYRYILMDHIATVHNRTIVDSENNFYKCFACMRSFSSQNRRQFLLHLKEHASSVTFCCDCNVNLESIHHLENHRERSHQDFSFHVRNNKESSGKLESKDKAAVKQAPASRKPQQLPSSSKPAHENFQEVKEEPEQYSVIEDNTQQQIMVQTEDGSLLNMNNFILTENGELIIQNLEGLLPNGQESGDDTGSGQIHISNLEQFLMEQGLSSGTEISYIQPDDNQVIIQNDDGTISQSSQGSLMQTYKEIFEPDENIPTELIASASDENVLLNGDFMTMAMHSNNGQIAEQVEVNNSAQVDANQSTLDELGDILLEVAAAAEKEKKPKVIEQKIVREALWGSKKRSADATSVMNNGSAKKRAPTTSRVLEPPQEEEPPASNFSQAYEFFVKGFHEKKQKQL